MASTDSTAAARNSARFFLFSMRHSGTAAKAIASSATRTKPMMGTRVTWLFFLLASVLVAHQRHDHAANGARLLIAQAGTHYHGAYVAHHGFPLGGGEKELCRVQLMLQMLEKPGQFGAGGGNRHGLPGA